LFQKSQSISQFENLLSREGIKTYHRNDKLCGVYYKNRKYRLKRSLGIDPELLLLKDKTLERIKSLGKVIDERDREQSKGYDMEF
jgi:hypothetical protein